MAFRQRIVFRCFFLYTLDADELEELEEYVNRAVKNKHLKKRQLKEIEKAMRLLQSLGSEPGEVPRPLDGTSLGACNESYTLWRVLKVVVVTPLSPEKVLRDVSVLRRVMYSGQVGRPGEGREFLFLGAGTMVVPNTACWGWDNLKGGKKYPSHLNLCSFVQFR
ncbi:hypothetical protein JOD02_001753 [Caldicoprobacter guelmensis]|uniref:hypothetical protein n=1 Tax=Caldicoprobacter guelmensis TaxID=1170224 RepID=UPI0019573A23|nr:hypothetical protein [Caldicoprobacter guelmensis]MBM7582884.1 hypothetical protein [Caldicoprobacter guelmensis]